MSKEILIYVIVYRVRFSRLKHCWKVTSVNESHWRTMRSNTHESFVPETSGTVYAAKCINITIHACLGANGALPEQLNTVRCTNHKVKERCRRSHDRELKE